MKCYKTICSSPHRICKEWQMSGGRMDAVCVVILSGQLHVAVTRVGCVCNRRIVTIV